MDKRRKIILTVGIVVCLLAAAVIITAIYLQSDDQNYGNPEQPVIFFVQPFQYSTLSPADADSPVTVMIPYEPLPQYTGLIIALEKGFFRQAGLNKIQLQWYDEPLRPLPLLKDDGKPDFYVKWMSDILKVDDPELRLVNVAQIFQKQSLLLIARASDDIKTPADFKGKKVGVWKSNEDIVKMLCLKHNVQPELIVTEPSIIPLLSNAVHVITANYYDEYEDLISAGFNDKDLVIFRFSDSGLDFPEYGLYCRLNTRKNNPEICRAVTSAMLNGWAYTIYNPKDAARIVVNYRRKLMLPSSYERTLSMLEKVIGCLGDNQQAAVARLGQLDKTSYDNMAKELLEDRAITKAPTYSEFYQPAFGQQVAR